MIRLTESRVRTKPLGLVLYQGPSTIDGQPIVAIATLKTANAKTGALIQTWIILRRHPAPLAINTGDDASVCGTCPLRGVILDGRNVGRACYVQVRNAPYQIWQAYRAGRYPHYVPREHAKYFRGRKLRLGAMATP